MPLTNGQTYYYSIFTYDSSGNYSVAVTGTGTPNIAVNPVAILGANGDDLKFYVSWEKSDIADSYNVYYGTEPGIYGPPVTIATSELTDANSPSTTIQSGLANNVTYWIAVSAIYSGVESVKSAEVTVVTGAPMALAQPTGLEHQNGNNSMRLTWELVSPAVDGYKVYYGTTSGVYTGTNAEEGSSPIQFNGNIATCDIHGLINDTVYYFAIQAFRGAQLSPMSEEVRGMPQNAFGSFTPGEVISLNIGSGSNLLGVPVSVAGLTARSFTSKAGGTVVFWRQPGKFINSIIAIPVGQPNKGIEGADAYYINNPGLPRTIKFVGQPWQ